MSHQFDLSYTSFLPDIQLFSIAVQTGSLLVHNLFIFLTSLCINQLKITIQNSYNAHNFAKKGSWPIQSKHYHIGGSVVIERLRAWNSNSGVSDQQRIGLSPSRDTCVLNPLARIPPGGALRITTHTARTRPPQFDFEL